jgi:tetratricopeptide (TPR) repeat protein
LRQIVAQSTKKPPTEIPYIEHELSILGKDSNEELNRSEDLNNIHFKWKDKLLLKYSKESIKVKSGYAQMFSMFFRYYFGGHPKILNELNGMSEIPRNINGYIYGNHPKSYSLSFVDFKIIPANPFSFEGMTPVGFDEKDNTLFALLNRMKEVNERDMRNNLINLSDYFDKEIKRENYLEAFLAIFEYKNQTGTSLPPSMSRKFGKGLESEDIKKLFEVIGNTKDKEEALKRVSDLQEFQKLTNKRKAMLLVFEANHYRALGGHQQAVKSFVRAFEQNPYLAGAWKDFGDLFFVAYMPIESWRCWDIARRISPDHELVKAIKVFENNLATNYPEYFIP